MTDESGVKLSPRPLCPSTWGQARGYIQVRDPHDGTVHEIPYAAATPVWKQDIRRNSNRG